MGSFLEAFAYDAPKVRQLSVPKLSSCQQVLIDAEVKGSELDLRGFAQVAGGLRNATI